MNDRALAIFFRDMANMLISGIGLEHSLRTLSETAMQEGARRMCAGALARLQGGVSLSDALAASGVLPREALMSISAGETAGELPDVFNMLGNYFELKAAMRQKALSALGYPVLVMVIMLGVLLYMVVEVLPKVAVLLPSGAFDSPVTSALVAAAWFLKSWGLLTGGLLALGVGALLMLARYKMAELRIMISRIPFLSQLVKEQELALGFFALFVLQKSGVNLERALREAAEVAGGATRQHLRDCSAYLVGGLALSEAVRQDRYFPRFTADTLRIGEESGRFAEYFERLFQVFYRMFQSRMSCLAGAVRPVMLAVCGAFIALIAVGFLQPLYGNLTGIAAPQ
ncbi:MAG: type II secretion system F family protein [Candidatus Omnitrophica bacterium]|nr:type II secretion system F family protein [Candidatus Omnitrophota bacterium]